MAWPVLIVIAVAYAIGAGALWAFFTHSKLTWLKTCGMLFPIAANFTLITLGNLTLLDSSRPRDGALMVLFGLVVAPVALSSGAIFRSNFKLFLLSGLSLSLLPLTAWALLIGGDWPAASTIAKCALSAACESLGH
ncbi:MAG: hypothetical protein K1X79_00810 [Oligoflexia bacterium]|nr:hypothetical protein [Oligoflexia bacterium]